MKILITGAGGMLGSDLVKALEGGHEIIRFASDRSRPSEEHIAVLNEPLISRTFAAEKPEVVIHTAAYTDVDGAEKNEPRALLINVTGTRNIVRAANRIKATLFFISTDYVFDGEKTIPYDEKDEPNSRSVYGRSKQAAEALVKSEAQSAFIIRTSWLFGGGGKNFFRSILEKGLEHKEIRVVNDQKGAPTYTKDLANAFKILVEKAGRRSGCHIYHLANSGETTWYGAARRLLEKARFEGKIIPVNSDELNRPAKRPANSVLNMEKIKKDFDIQLRPWNEALDEFWDEVLKHEWESALKPR